MRFFPAALLVFFSTLIPPAHAQRTYRGNARVDLGVGSYGDKSGNSSIGMTYPAYQTEVELTPLEGKMVELVSPFAEPKVCNYILGNESKTQEWSKYIQGATAVAALNRLPINGFKMVVNATVPNGIGMSSSAALLKALWEGLNDLNAWGLSDLELVALARKTENSAIVGAETGDYDHGILKLAPLGQAVRLDFGGQTLQFQNADWFKNARIGLIHSGFEHKLSEDAHAVHHPWETERSYNQRVHELTEGARRLGFSSPDELNRLTEYQLKKYRDLYGNAYKAQHGVDDPIYLRLLHAYKEARLTQAAWQYLADQNLPGYVNVVNRSAQNAERNLQNTTPATELLIRVGRQVAKEHGLKIFAMKGVGGGDGGAVLVLTDDQIPAGLYEEIRARYASARLQLWGGIEPELDQKYPSKVIFPIQ